MDDIILWLNGRRGCSYTILDGGIIYRYGLNCSSVFAGHLRDAGLEVFNGFPLSDFVVGRRRPVVVLMLQRRQVGQRHFRPRGRSRHRFQLYAKAVVRVVRIGPRRVVVDVSGFRFLAGKRGGSNAAAAAAERPQLGQDEPPGVPALLDHRSARTEFARGRGGRGSTWRHATAIISWPRRRRL